MRFVSRKASIDERVYLGEGVRIYGSVIIEPNVVVEDYSIIGAPDMFAIAAFDISSSPRVQQFDDITTRPTILRSGARIGSFTQVYEGSEVSYGVETENHVRIGWDSFIGEGSRLMYNAQVYCYTKIGAYCRIGGFVADNSRIGDRVSFFGAISHDYPYWTGTYEYRPYCNISDDVIVGFGAQLIGGITVGSRAYIAANAVVTKDVPSGYLAFGVNKCVPKRSWKGKIVSFWGE